MRSATVEEPLRFGRFTISEAERVLRVDGQPVSLGARGFDLLLVLAQRRERLVTKQELLDLVWPGLVVEEHNITAQISTLRKLLGAHAIATVPGRGYRFTAPLTAAFPKTYASRCRCLRWRILRARIYRANSRRCSDARKISARSTNLCRQQIWSDIFYLGRCQTLLAIRG